MKDKFIHIRVSEQEYEEIRKKAEELNLNVSTYVRMVAVKAQMNIGIKEQGE